MSLYESVITSLKGVIGSNKNGVLLQEIDYEYEILNGDKIPLKELGYTSIHSFIKSVPNSFRIQNVGKYQRVFNVIGVKESESNLALYNMILNTNSKKSNTKFKFKTKNIYERNRYDVYSSKNQYNGKFQLNEKGFAKSFSNQPISMQNFELNNYEKRSQKKDLYNYENLPDFELKEVDSKKSVSVQTTDMKYKTITKYYFSLKPEEFANIIIDLIVEFKPLHLDNVVFFKISTDLYYYFTLFTGLSIDPCLFTDIVLEVLSSVKDIEMYENIIYNDNSDKFCCLNLQAIENYSLISLPYLELKKPSSYLVNILSMPNKYRIVSVSFCEESKNLLRWTKNNKSLSDQANFLIENQEFWSWIPGSLCLAQLPFSYVKKLNIRPVERAIIVSTEIATPIEVKCQNSLHVIFHRTTFYLVDHKLTISNILSCSSTFQKIKRRAYKENDTNIAYVCNMSVRARCEGPVIQFLKIININEFSTVMYDECGNLHQNFKVSVYQIQRLNMMKNFQPIFECYASIPKDKLDYGRAQYDEVIHYVNLTKSNKDENEEIEVIVISDSDDDGGDEINKTTSNNRTLCNSDMLSCNITSKNSIDILHSVQIPEISFENGMDTVKMTPSLDNEIDELVDNISVISFNNDISSFGEENNEISFKENVNSDINSEGTKIITQDLNLNNSEKCIIPITPDLCSKFEGRVVQIMYLQLGAAVLMLLDSTTIMKRELQMLSFVYQDLNKVQAIKKGDFYLWFPKVKEDYIRTYNNKKMALVEILQVVNNDTTLASLVHYGLIVTLKYDELFHIPNFVDNYQDFKELIEPVVAAFDLHLIPNWFSMVIDKNVSNKLFYAYFINGNELVLEYFGNPCEFLNIELLSLVEDNLTINHCNFRSKSFIASLSEFLLMCRLFIGNLLILSTSINTYIQLDNLSISNTLIPVTEDDDCELWFASVDIENDKNEFIQKLSPCCLSENKFCIDRVRLNKALNKIQLLDCQNIDMDVPNNFDGIYKFDQNLMNEYMRSSAEYYSRYMLIGAIKIPELNYLFNKLTF